MINSNKLTGCIKEILVLADVLDSIAKKKGTELVVSSGFRDMTTNIAAGGATHSLHLTGRAIDFCFQDTHIFKIIGELLQLCLDQQGAFKGITQLECVKGFDKTNHIHIAYGPEGFLKTWTGVYE